MRRSITTSNKLVDILVNDMIAMKEVVGGLFVGMCLAALMTATTERNVGPSWMKYLAFVGFVVSLNWIYAVANEVVGLLQVSKRFREYSMV